MTFLYVLCILGVCPFPFLASNENIARENMVVNDILWFFMGVCGPGLKNMPIKNFFKKDEFCS
jgi:hypothetical protein